VASVLKSLHKALVIAAGEGALPLGSPLPAKHDAKNVTHTGHHNSARTTASKGFVKEATLTKETMSIGTIHSKEEL